MGGMLAGKKVLVWGGGTGIGVSCAELAAREGAAIFLAGRREDVLREAALKGIGIALLPTFIAGKDIAAKRLQIVLPENQPDDLTIHALYAPNRYLAAKTRVFIDFLVDRFGNTPSWDVCFAKR